MTDEGQVFSRTAPAAGPTGDASAASLPSGIPEGQPAATDQPAPTAPQAPAAESQPTQDQLREWQQAYQNRENWQRSNTQKAQELAEQARQLREENRWVYDFVDAYSGNEAFRSEVEAAARKHFGQQPPTTPATPAQEGQQPPAGVDPELAQRVSQMQAQLQAIERERLLQEADAKYNTMFSEYKRITGNEMPPQTFWKIKNDLNVSGSIDPVQQMYYSCRDEFLQQRAAAAQAGAQQAAEAAGRATVEGASGGGGGQRDLASMSQDEADRLGRLAATGGIPDADYNPFIYTKPS